LATRYQTHSVSGSGGGSAIAFGFVRDGQIVNRKYRTSLVQGDKGKIWQDKGGVKCVWNEDVLRDDTLLDQPLIITEGELDALSAIQAGFVRTISVPDGAPATALGENAGVKYSFLDAIRPLLAQDRVREVILAVDGDSAGANLLHDLSLQLGRYRCKFLTYPKNPHDRDVRLKDLNEVLQAFGPKGVVETINRSQFLKVEGVYRMSELPPPPEAPVYDIGFGKFSENYKVRLGDFAVWTGIPSHGKSSMVNDLCCRLVHNHGLNIAFASFEQMPTRDHRRNLRTWYLRRPPQSAEKQDVIEADKWIDKHFSFLVPTEDDDVTVDWVLDKLEAAVVQHGCKVVVIDPWNEMDHMREKAESTTEYTGRAIKAFKRFARKFMVHLIVVAHPSKQQKDKDGNYMIPTLYDISDSAHWYNKADLGVVVHRETESNSIIRVAKSRYHDEIGRPGEVNATYNFFERRFNIA
jgi:twinkle protein